MINKEEEMKALLTRFLVEAYKGLPIVGRRRVKRLLKKTSK